MEQIEQTNYETFIVLDEGRYKRDGRLVATDALFLFNGLPEDAEKIRGCTVGFRPILVKTTYGAVVGIIFSFLASPKLPIGNGIPFLHTDTVLNVNNPNHLKDLRQLASQEEYYIVVHAIPGSIEAVHDVIHSADGDTSYQYVKVLQLPPVMQATLTDLIAQAVEHNGTLDNLDFEKAKETYMDATEELFMVLLNQGNDGWG